MGDAGRAPAPDGPVDPARGGGASAEFRDAARDARPYCDLTLRERLVRHHDLAAQIIGHQIQIDYTRFFKRHVQPRMGTGKLGLRAHSLLLALGQVRHATGVELAFLIRSDPATVSRNVSTLVERGLATAAPDPGDARAIIYTLTGKGAKANAIYLAEWESAVARADRHLGTPMSEDDFRASLAVFYDLKDRARAFALWSPRKDADFRRGIGRPEPAKRPDVTTLRAHADSFFRFFGQQISSDYLLCISRRLAKPVLLETGLSLTDLRTLMCIDFRGRPLSGADISRSMRFDPATVARSTQALAEAGYVTVRPHAEDSRQTMSALTERGHALAESYRRAADALVADVEAAFDIAWTEEKRDRAITRLLAARDRAHAFAKLRKLPR